MKNKGKRFVVRISKTANTMEIQAIHNLRNLGYLVEAVRFSGCHPGA
jgi:hypothetical protein